MCCKNVWPNQILHTYYVYLQVTKWNISSGFSEVIPFSSAKQFHFSSQYLLNLFHAKAALLWQFQSKCYNLPHHIMQIVVSFENGSRPTGIHQNLLDIIYFLYKIYQKSAHYKYLISIFIDTKEQKQKCTK